MIDPHYKVSSVSGMEENSNDSQGLLLAALENICTMNGAALILSHHFAKGDAGAKNAALLAVAILATTDKKLRQKLEAFRKKQSDNVLSAKLPK